MSIQYIYRKTTAFAAIFIDYIRIFGFVNFIFFSKMILNLILVPISKDFGSVWGLITSL